VRRLDPARERRESTSSSQKRGQVEERFGGAKAITSSHLTSRTNTGAKVSGA